MEAAGTKNQRIHFQEDYHQMQNQGHLLIKETLTIRSCMEHSLLLNTSFTHVSLEIQLDKTVVCILVNCRAMNCTRLPAARAAVLLLTEPYLYGGLLGPPVTTNIKDGELAAFCKIHALNEFPVNLHPSDQQEVMLASSLVDLDTIKKCVLYISSNSATGQAENRGHEHLCLGLKPTLQHLPPVEPCMAVRTLLGDPRAEQDRQSTGRRRRRNIMSFIMNLIRLTSLHGSQVASQASRFAPGAASRAMQSATPLGLSYTPSVSRLSLDAVSLAGGEVAKIGVKESLKRLAANSIIQAIGIGAATTITSVTVPILLEEAAADLRATEARELRAFVNNNYEASQDSIRGLSNYSHVSWGIEGTLRLKGGPEVLPSNHSKGPIRLALPAPESFIFNDLFPQTTTTSFKKINALQMRLWELLTFYSQCAEILVKTFRGDLLLPGLTKHLETGEFWVISLLEDRAKQSKYKKDGVRIQISEIQTDLRPVIDEEGRLRRLKTLTVSGRFDPCRSYHSGYIAPWCFFYSNQPFTNVTSLLGGYLITVYRIEVSIACGDGTIHIGSEEYAVLTVPTQCIIEQGMNVGHAEQNSSIDDIKIYCRIKLEHLPYERDQNNYRRQEPIPTPQSENERQQPQETSTIFPYENLVTAREIWLSISYPHRVLLIGGGALLVVFIGLISLCSDIYSNLFACLTTTFDCMKTCRQRRQTVLQHQRRQEQLKRLACSLKEDKEMVAMLPVAGGS